MEGHHQEVANELVVEKGRQIAAPGLVVNIRRGLIRAARVKFRDEMLSDVQGYRLQLGSQARVGKLMVMRRK